MFFYGSNLVLAYNHNFFWCEYLSISQKNSKLNYMKLKLNYITACLVFAFAGLMIGFVFTLCKCIKKIQSLNATDFEKTLLITIIFLFIWFVFFRKK